MKGRVRVVAAGIAGLLVCALFFMLFIRPRQSDITKIESDISAAQAQSQQLQLDLERLQALKENAPQLNATLEEIRGFVPKEDELTNFMLQVQDAANTAGVDFSKITPELPKPPAQPAPLAEIRITMTATGGFFSLQDFIRRLYALDRALRIDTLTLAAEGTGGTGEASTGTDTSGTDAGDLNLTIAARIFFELPEGAAAPPPATDTAPQDESIPTDPAATETTAPDAAPAQ